MSRACFVRNCRIHHRRTTWIHSFSNSCTKQTATFFLSFFQKVPHLSLRFAVLLSLTEKAGIIRAFSLKANRVTLLHGTNILFINRTPIVTGLYKTNKTLQSLCCRVLFVIVESCFEESCREILFFFFLKMFFKRQKRSKTGRENRIHTKAWLEESRLENHRNSCLICLRRDLRIEVSLRFYNFPGIFFFFLVPRASLGRYSLADPQKFYEK